jgi:hypothetical protein
MDIKFKNVAKTELFCNIEVGECFVVDFNTPDQIICMKTFEDPVGGDANTVDLQTGEVYHFDDDEEVIPLKVQITARLGG